MQTGLLPAEDLPAALEIHYNPPDVVLALTEEGNLAMRSCVTALTLFAALSGVTAGRADELAKQATAVLKQYCHQCHGITKQAPGLDVLDLSVLTANRGEELPYITPGDPAQSLIWRRAGVEQDMPPEGNPQPTPEERAILEQWITAGAEAAAQTTRQFLNEEHVMGAIAADLKRQPAEVRRTTKYFGLTNLYNNRQTVTDDDLRQARVALAKLVNSLSWENALVIPRAVDIEQSVYALDIRDVGWSDELWNEVRKAYPYGLNFQQQDNETLRDLAKEVATLAQDEFPYYRADWFLATASRPPLYHVLLELPEEVEALRDRLNVDVAADFQTDRLVRAGLISSGVSAQNRLVDRHHSLYGAYWESYDFKTNEGRGNLLRFPLGPTVSAGETFAEQSFQHDGGEIIFNLPNGLQGYFLINEKGARIDEGPIAVVSDTLRTSGTPSIVNGLSCMACHSRGVIPFRDVLRDSAAVFGTARSKVQTLIPTQEALDKIFQKDRDRFGRALAIVTDGMLGPGAASDEDPGASGEPIGVMGRWYIRELGPDEAAAELGIEDARDLAAMVRGNRRLRELGLRPLGQGGTIKRDVWSNPESGSSLFHEAAREFEVGIPLRNL